MIETYKINTYTFQSLSGPVHKPIDAFTKII